MKRYIRCAESDEIKPGKESNPDYDIQDSTKHASPKGPAWIVRYNYDTGSRESGPYPEWNEILIYAPTKEMAEAMFEKNNLVDVPGHYDGCSVRKATKSEIRQWERAWAEDDKYQLQNTRTPEYALYQNKKNRNKYIEVKRSADGHSWFRPFVYWNTDRGPVKNYIGSKTNRGRYRRATKDTLQKVLDEYIQVDDVHAEYDDPADLMSATSITATKTQRMTDFQLEHLLELADDMFYQIHENYRHDEYSRKDIIDMVIEHVIMVITEMDDDDVYEDLLPFASTKNRQFVQNLKEHLNEMYDTVEWGV